MVKTLCFHFSEHGFNPWSGNLRSPRPCGIAIKKKKEKVLEISLTLPGNMQVLVP